MITMKIIFEQWFELQVAESLIVHVLSSSHNVSALSFEMKGKQPKNGIFVSSRILYPIRTVYTMRICMWTSSKANSGL